MTPPRLGSHPRAGSGATPPPPAPGLPLCSYHGSHLNIKKLVLRQVLWVLAPAGGSLGAGGGLCRGDPTPRDQTPVAKPLQDTVAPSPPPLALSPVSPPRPNTSIACSQRQERCLGGEIPPPSAVQQDFWWLVLGLQLCSRAGTRPRSICIPEEFTLQKTPRRSSRASLERRRRRGDAQPARGAGGAKAGRAAPRGVTLTRSRELEARCPPLHPTSPARLAALGCRRGAGA